MLDNRLPFEEHLRLVFSKINKAIGLLRKLQCLISRYARLTVYKTFVRPHPDYGDIIYMNKLVIHPFPRKWNESNMVYA